jgi:hypothetical protein
MTRFELAYMDWPVAKRRPTGTDEELRAKFRRWHKDRCAMCGRDGGGCEDHCHWTGRTRGYLCRSCNMREWQAPGDREPWATYRRHPPAMRFRIETYYTNQFGSRPLLREVDDDDPASWGMTDRRSVTYSDGFWLRVHSNPAFALEIDPRVLAAAQRAAEREAAA